MTIPARPADIVRLLISDLGEPRTFSDTDLGQMLLLEGGSIKLAAAQALDTIASDQVLVLKRITSLDLQTDGPAVAKELRAHATALRAQVAAGQDDSGTPSTPDDDGADFAVFTVRAC